MQLRRSLLVSLLFALGCQTSKPVSDLLLPAPATGQPKQGAPLPFEDAVPPEPALPVAGPEGCIEPASADAFRMSARERRVAVERQEAAARGWRELTVFETGEVAEENVYLHSMEIELKNEKRGRFVDQNGDTWLAVAEYGCSAGDLRYYIDERDQVFEVHSSPTCGSTAQMSVCGTWAMDGCGVEPPRTILFVKVPRGARLLGQPANIEAPFEQCASFEPTEGYSYPP